MRTPRLLALSSMLCASIVLAQPNSPCDELRALTAESPAHWGVSVRTLEGKTICALDEAKLFRPASNNKLLTTATALAVLGPAYTLRNQGHGNFDPQPASCRGIWCWWEEAIQT